MTRYLCIFLIVFIAPNFSIAQSLSIDSSTLRASNEYLIKGLKARELNSIYKKQRHTDSVYIGVLRSVIKIEMSKNAECLDENHKIKKQNKTLWSVTIGSLALSILLIIFN
jgi:hypothetical protein